MEPKRFLRLTRAEWKENVDSLLWAVALALAIRTFVVAPFKIPSGSMRPTLIEGDRILVTKFLHRFRTPERGDIIVFYFPNEWHPLPERLRQVTDGTRPLGQRLSQLITPGRPFIKRLIGLGGDRVEIRDGHVFVNGTRLNERAYKNDGLYGRDGEAITVPPDAYFVLGDNTGSSHDGRYWGFVPKRLLIGRAWCIFWPWSRWRLLR